MTSLGKWTLACISILFIVGFMMNRSSTTPEQDFKYKGLRPAVFFSPHPDDETLNMGVTIAKHVKAGRPVYIVLLTHGRTTGVLPKINQSLHHEKKHGVHGPIDRNQIEMARIREFYNACKSLEIPRSHLFIHYLDQGDKAIPYQETKKITKKMVKKFPDADFYALSWLDIHADHAMSGQALKDLYLERTTDLSKDRVHFLISMATRLDMRQKSMTPPGIKDITHSNEVRTMVRKAMDSYNDWNPVSGSYAIGYHSVRSQFNQFSRELYHYIHGLDIHQFPSSNI